jgi:hypothetical protein
VTTLAGSGSRDFADVVGAAASFNWPQGVSFSIDGSLVAVAGSGNNKVRILVVATGAVTTLAGGVHEGV